MDRGRLQRALPRLLAVALAGASLLKIGGAVVGPTRGLQAEYFDSDRPGGTPAMTFIDRHVTDRQLLARWYATPPASFSTQWFGFLTAPRAGRYTFALTADDAAFLSVDGRRLIDNGGRHAAETRAADVTLSAGPHVVLIEYTQYGGDLALGWQWARNGGQLSDVPAWALSPYKVATWKVLTARVVDLAAACLASVAIVALLLLVWMHRQSIARFPRTAALVFFAILSVVHTWPLATNPGSLARHDNRDTLLNEWIVSWVAHQATHDPLHLFDANIFFPERDTLAYSEPLVPQAAMGAPMRAFGASPVLTYNLLLMLGLGLTGWSMCLVIARWTEDWTAGLVSGAIFAFNAHVLTRIPHLQAQHVEFLPPALFALDRLLQHPTARQGLRLASWSVLQALTSIHLLIFTLVALVAATLARPREWTGTKLVPVVKALGVGAVVAAAVLVPFLFPYYRVNHDQGLTRSLGDAAMYAATWMDYLSTPSRLHYSLWSHRFFFGTALFPGALGVLLTLLAIVRGNALGDPRARMCLAIGLAGFVLSFGPTLPGYSTLYAFVPLFQAIRATARFGYLVTLAVAAVAGFGVVTLRRIVPVRVWPVAVVLLVGCASLESVAAPLGLSRFDGVPPIYARVPRDGGARVVEIPFFGPRSGQFHAAYMLNSTANWQPLVNGYSGFQPGSFFRHAEALAGFPDDRSMTMLSELGVTHVFVHEDQMSGEELVLIKTRRELELVETFGSIALYRRR
jgi:hypothetical protein